eukprot:g27459.t1
MGKTGGYDARAPLEWLLEEGSTLSDLVEAPFGPAQLQMDVEAEEAKAGVDDKLDVDKELPQPVAKQDGKRPACDKEVGKDCEEDEEDALLSPEEILERERKKDPTARYIKVSLQFEESSKILKALKEKRRHGAFKQNISADQNKQRENTNKFQSCKAEMELLESGKYGPLDQDCGLDHAERPKARRSYSLAGWTGRKPKEALEDFGRNKWGKKKDGLPYAKYSKLSGAGGFRVRVTVQLPKNERRRFDPEEPRITFLLCESKEEAEHLAATLALMKLSQDSEKPGEDELALQEMNAEAAERLRRSYRERQQSLEEDAQFDELQQLRQRLPVAEFKEQFLRAVSSQGVVVVSGATGSGKTTQAMCGA